MQDLSYHNWAIYPLLSGKSDDRQKLRWLRIRSDPWWIIGTFVSTYLKVLGTIPLNKFSTFFLILIGHLQQNYHRRRNFARTKLLSYKYTITFNLNGIRTECLINMNIVFCRLRGQDGAVDVSGCNKISSSWKKKWHQARFIHSSVYQTHEAEGKHSWSAFAKVVHRKV